MVVDTNVLILAFLTEGAWSVLNETYNYTLEDKKVIWWGETLHQDQLFNFPTVLIRWIAPDGSVHAEDKKNQTAMRYVTASLPIKEALGSKDQREWRVRVFVDGNLHEEKSFVIGNIDSINLTSTH